jgi:cobalt-zinc-cadmium efflux system protein
MSHSHHHHHHHHHGAVTGRRMVFSVGLTLAFVLGESAAGLFSHSLALLSDAGHNFADALALVLAWYALGAARRPANASRTFGYHRVGILAALVNAVTLVVIAVLIFWEAFQRLRSPAPVQSGLMIGVALAALLMNTVISLWLRGEAKHDLNVRSAYLHMVGDALSSLGVVAAGAMIAITGNTTADPAVSLLIGALILWSSGGILTEAVTVLLEAAPSSLDMAAVEQEIQSVSGVMDVHDLHVWSVATGIVACSCHILVAEQSVRSGQQVLRAVAELLEHRFGITHTTVQVEVEGCEPNDMYCTMRHAHHH